MSSLTQRIASSCRSHTLRIPKSFSSLYTSNENINLPHSNSEKDLYWSFIQTHQNIKKRSFFSSTHSNLSENTDNTTTPKEIVSIEGTPAAGLLEFRDNKSREDRSKEIVGRSWSVKELRLKSFDDLHKLWYVLYKERNMLLTEKNLSRRHSIRFPQPERIVKVKKSMAAIKVVLGERKRDAIAQHALKRMSMDNDEHALDDEHSIEEEEIGTNK